MQYIFITIFLFLYTLLLHFILVSVCVCLWAPCDTVCQIATSSWTHIGKLIVHVWVLRKLLVSVCGGACALSFCHWPVDVDVHSAMLLAGWESSRLGLAREASELVRTLQPRTYTSWIDSFIHGISLTVSYQLSMGETVCVLRDRQQSRIESYLKSETSYHLHLHLVANDYR